MTEIVGIVSGAGLCVQWSDDIAPNGGWSKIRLRTGVGRGSGTVLAHVRREPPIGWVLEADGGVVGYLGNISMPYRYGDRILTVVVSHGLVVDRPYRAIGMTLAAAFFCHKSVDLYVCTTATKAVGKMARAFKCNSITQPDYDTVLFWVLLPYPCGHVGEER